MRVTKQNKITAIAITAASAALILAGCSSPSTDPVAAGSDAEFWKSLGFVSASEVNPATSLEDLTNRASLIVTASIGAVREGPTLVTETEGDADVVDYTTYLDLDVSETIAGTVDGSVTVWVPGGGTNQTEVAPTTVDSAWYLIEAGTPGIYVVVADAGVIAADGETLITVREPSTSEEIIPPGITSIDDLVDATTAYID